MKTRSDRRTPALLLGGLLLATSAFAASGAASQETRPIQVSLVAPIQIFPEEYAIEGLRLNLIYGRNAGMTGIDLGLANHSTGHLEGIQLGIVNLVDGPAQGVQLGAVNLAESMVGVQMGEVFGGSLVNRVTGRMRGFQFALVNIGGQSYEGVQLGLVNVADDMNGFQVGIVNIIKSKESLAFLPLVNWKFDEGMPDQ